MVNAAIIWMMLNAALLARDKSEGTQMSVIASVMVMTVIIGILFGVLTSKVME